MRGVVLRSRRTVPPRAVSTAQGRNSPPFSPTGSQRIMNEHATDPSVTTSAPSPTGLPKRSRGLRAAQDEVPPEAGARARPDRLERALSLARRCARIAEDNRAKDILLLDLRKSTPLVDFFVIATASSRRLANAIASDIDAEMKREDENKLGIEGVEDGRWVLIDYGDFVVHLFNPDSRAYYALEEIWGDAPRLDWSDTAPAASAT